MDIELFEKNVKLLVKNHEYKIINEIINRRNKEERKIVKKHLRKLLKDSGNANTVIFGLFGKIEAMDDNYEKAISCYKKMKTMTQLQEEAMYMDLARVEFKRNNFDKVKQYCSMIRSPKHQYFVNYVLGNLEMISKNYDLAKEYFTKSSFKDGETHFYKEIAWINIREKNYAEALKNLCLFIKHNGDNHQVAVALLFLCKELNIFINDFDIDYRLNLYTSQQIVNYKLSRTIKHISKHQKEDSEYDHFDPNIDLKMFINQIMNKLDEKYRISTEFWDVYILPIKDIGVNGSNYLKVITIPNTQKIITMYPISNMTDCDEYTIEDEAKVLKFN